MAVSTNMLERLLVVGHSEVAADKPWKERQKLRSENEPLVESSETSN